MRSDLPVGTVTLMFTDVEGSTRLLHELGPQGYAEVLAEHRSIVRDACSRHGGVEVDTQGDAFFVAFASAPSAVAAAIEMATALDATPVRVRVGIHTGTPHVTGEGYVGPDVNKGARIAATGHGGQILLSKEMRAQVDVDVSDLGEHRVKDFDQPVWIYQVGGGRFPPLKSISNTNLPRPASSLVGRAREVTEIAARLSDGARLVTLAGPGGTGKTRLSIAAATELVPAFANGVFWVPLATLRDPALVTEEIAQTVGATDGLADHIAERDMLLVLDNFEQVIAAAPEVSALLERCPNLKVMVTSRELLRIAGEISFDVPPLDVTEAVELFCTRSGLEPDDSIAELCRRLDGLPLAVELAAARTRVMAPAKILERLARRLDLLRGGRDADPRQQTLRATIEWSYDLLDEGEKKLFARLGVFRGGATLEAAEQVCEADIDTLQSLVDKSLVRHSGERFWMLETIRDYAAERLAASGEADDIAQLHAEFFVAVAEEAEPRLREYSKEWLDRIGHEHDNVRAALDYLEAHNETQLVLRMTGAIADFWAIRGHYTEARRRLEPALDKDLSPTAARAKALYQASDAAMASGDQATAKARAKESLALHRDLGNAWGETYSTFLLADVAANEKDWGTGRELFAWSAERFRALGDEQHAMWSTRMLGWMYSELGDRSRARELHEDNLRRARVSGNEMIVAESLEALSHLAVADGRAMDAPSMLEEAYAIRSGLDDLFRVGVILVRWAMVLSARGIARDAVRCLACGEVVLDESGANPPWVKQMTDEALAAIRDRLDDASFAEAWEEGTKLTPEQGVALALAALGPNRETN